MSKNKEALVRIETSEGDITIKLYNETPLHRDNFLKLVKEGTYDGLLFHRIIKDFMIQGGDPESKNAPKGAMLGSGSLGYTIPAEFVYPKYFHKRGALSAARTGDNVNPQKESSASQFYIVWGKVYDSNSLKQMEGQKLNALQQKIFNRLQTENRDKILELYNGERKDELEVLKNELIAQMETEAKQRQDEAAFAPEQAEAYTTIGGTPHLDGEYTVFGEVVEGLEVVEKIQSTETGHGDRPVNDISIKTAIVKG